MTTLKYTALLSHTKSKHFSLTALLFILLLSSSFAQNINTIYITKSYNNAPVIDILNEFKTEYALRIYYKPAWFAQSSFSGSFKATPLLTALNTLFDNSKLTYLTIDQNIYVIPKENIALILRQMTDRNQSNDLFSNYIVIGDINKVGKSKTVIINGTVTDGANSYPLPGTKILVENTEYYAVTGYSGQFVLEVPPGRYNLKAISMGYEDNIIPIKALSNGTLSIAMFEESHAINEVVISSERSNNNVARNQMSMIELDAKSIKQLPSLIGEPDIIKSFATMPGVKSASEFGSGINVRGGSEDQNLFLLENCPIYNTSHVMGLLSVINPDAVNSVALYKGHIPIEYGERVSSVMDIGINDPLIDDFKIKGGIGIYSSRLLLETPLFNKLVKFKLGARSSYSDFLLKKIPDYNLQHSSASFYDITSSAFVNLKNNPITLFAYYSYDYFKYATDYAYKYGNRLLSLSWTHVFNPNLSVNTYGAYSNYLITSENKQSQPFYYASESWISSKTGKIKFEYLGLYNQALQAGIQGIQYTINPGDKTPIENAQIEPFYAEKEQGNELSAFIGDDISINSKIAFSVGLRYTIFNSFGPKTVFNYDANEPMLPENITDSTLYTQGERVVKYSGFEPRVSFKYMFSAASSLKLSYNRNKQYLSLLSYTSISTPEDTWKLADPYMKPIIVDQVAVGYYRNFFNNNIETSVEVYGKKLENLTEYRNGAELKFNKHVETELLNATGTNYGIEFLAKKKNGKLTGTLSYTYSRAWKQSAGKWLIDRINRNEKYPSQYDIPHDFSLNMNYKINRRIRLGTNFSYATGRPVTLPEYTYNLGSSKLVYYSDRNKYRLPDYHRLDVSLSIDESLKKKKKWKGSWTFAVLNVYGRKNAYSIFYQKDTPTPENDYQAFSLYKMYLIGIPMPTITYNFIF